MQQGDGARLARFNVAQVKRTDKELAAPDMFRYQINLDTTVQLGAFVGPEPRRLGHAVFLEWRKQDEG